MSIDWDDEHIVMNAKSNAFAGKTTAYETVSNGWSRD
jgi:hypothetical protein